MARENLCRNPSFAYLLREWAKIAPATVRIGSDTDSWGGYARQSPQYLAIDVPPGTQGPAAAPTAVTVAGGQTVAISALVRTSPGLAVAVSPEWTVGGRSVTEKTPALLAASADGVRPVWAFTAPSGATAVRLRFEARTTSSAERGTLPGWVYVDDVLIVAAPTPGEALEAAAGEFFDGDTPPSRIGYSSRALTHQWTGARGVSTSREVEADVDMSSLPVAIVGGGQAPRVQVVIPPAAVPAGAACYVEGVTDTGFTWTPRGGVWESKGLQRIIGDPLAPINVPIRYRLTTSRGVTVESEPVVRSWGGLSLMTDAAGLKPVNFLWQGTDQRELKLRLTEHEVPGRSTPLVVYAPTMGRGTVSLTARTNLQDTPAMKTLLASPTPVAIFHNPLHCVQCKRGTCDVDPVTLIAVTSAPMERAARLDAAERIWQLKGTIVDLPQPNTPLTLSTWNDFDKRRLTWSGLDARRWPWDQFDRTVWQEDA